MGKKTLFVSTGLLLLFVTLLIYNSYYVNKISKLNQGQGDGKKINSAEQKQPYNEPVNILVIGIDQRGDETSRSDTIMVYHLDFKSSKISLLNIPRDTYVNIQGRGMDKVNHAYAFGGYQLSRQTIEEFLGIKIDYYLETNFTGFTSLIDRVKGITLDVEKDIAGTDIKKGPQKLNGQRALAYVRDRNDPMGDIARVKRQQKFMQALAREVTQYSPKYKLTLELVNIYKSIKTDMSLEQAQTLYSTVEKFKLYEAQMDVVPGSFYNLNGISYWKPDIEKTKEIVQNLFSQSSTSTSVSTEKEINK